jgi:hypothetical protein
MQAAWAFLLLSAMACQTTTYFMDPAHGIYSGVPKNSQVVRSFDAEETAQYLFWGLVPIDVPTLQSMAPGGLQSDQVIGNLRITETNSFLDGLGAIITWGLYRPRLIEVEGTIYRLKEAHHGN